MKNKKQLLFGVCICLAALVWVFAGTEKGQTLLGRNYSFKEATTTYSVSVSVPQTKNKALNTAVATYVNSAVGDFTTLYAPSMFSPEDFEALGFADGRHYEFVIKGESWSYKNLSGVTLEFYTFTGGAHGGTQYITFLFDDAGIQLTLPQLFLGNTAFLERIAKAVQPDLKKQLEENQMYVEDFFTDGTRPDEGNFRTFTVGSDGITFIFQQYQVAPYVAGAPRVTVPFSVLQDILNPTYF